MKNLINILSVVLLSLASSLAMANSHKETIEKANQLYSQGLYDSSLVMYNSVLSENYQSAELYYNIGNAYFKNNNIPAAILYYEKARKLAPNDEDILYNLNICNSMIVDKIEKVPSLFYKQWWNYFYEMFNANSWAVLSLVIWSAFLVVLGFYILSKSRSSKKLSFYLGVLLLIASVGSIGLASQKYYYTKENKDAIIFTPTITVKSSPTVSSVDLFVVHEGTKVRILDKVDNWNKIKIQDGSIGWLPADAMKLI
ncbi:MAG: tetratricopeptide repeat protein [Chlorobi bacterium]|nr:tetratricopeptide repeat protein [Chlorobiota bacterium]